MRNIRSLSPLNCAMTQRRYNEITDERNSTRFRCTEGTSFAVLMLSGIEPILAEVYDESLDGVGLIFQEHCPLSQGQEVDLVFAGSFYRGQVRHIQSHASGGCLVGMQCQRLGPPPAATDSCD